MVGVELVVTVQVRARVAVSTRVLVVVEVDAGVVVSQLLVRVNMRKARHS